MNTRITSPGSAAINSGGPRTGRYGAAVATLLLGLAGGARADIICVSTAAEFLAAREAIVNGPEGSVWDIRLRPGTYQFNGNISFYTPRDRDNKQLFFSGGWNAGCTTQTLLPITTTLKNVPPGPDYSGGGSFTFDGENNRVEIRGLRFEDFGDVDVNDYNCGPYQICPDTKYFGIEYSEFVNGRGVGMYTEDADRMVFRGNLVRSVRSVHFGYNNNEVPPVFAFNTIVNTCSNGIGGTRIGTQRRFTAHHNVFKGCVVDLEIDDNTSTFQSDQPVTLRANMYSSVSGLVDGNPANPEYGNVQTLNYGFVDSANGNYRLAAGSVGVNGGLTPTLLIATGLGAPAVELDNAPRLRGTRYDIGAYESPVNNGAPPVLVVTTNADSGAGSLRAAIQAANAAAGTPQSIAFNIPGGCPQVIALASPLPDVTDAVVIDGYSRAASAAWPAAPNSAEVGSNATVCVVLTPTTAITHALQVPTGQPAGTTLAVRGLAFGSGFANYTQAPVQLRAGSNHRIEGNYFGGTGPSGLGNLGALPGALLVRGTAQSVQVGGGDDPLGNRNVFGRINVNATSNAITLNDATSGGHLIEGNLFGLMANGLNVEAIGNNAISASNVPAVEVRGNVIAAATGAAVSISGADATGWVLTGNRIGVSQIGIGTPASGHGNGNGVVISNGSAEHDIGVLAGLTDGQFSNEIRNSQGPGVWIGPTAGSGTSVAGNRIFANGLGGSGLAIDLGAVGPTPNDPGDGDSGPNGLQNAPLVVASTVAGSERNIAWTLNSVPNTPFKLHLYRSVACPGGGATGAELNSYIGSVDTSTNGSGNASGSATVSGIGAPGFITMTATRMPDGSTSEPSACFAEPAGGGDAVFIDSFE